jgi:hypothetical protein
VSYGGSSQMAVSFAFGLIHSALRLIHREGWDVPEQEKPTLEHETLEHETLEDETLEDETLEPSILILEEFSPPRAEDEIFLPSA